MTEEDGMRCSRLRHRFTPSKMIQQALPFKHTEAFRTQINIGEDERKKTAF